MTKKKITQGQTGLFAVALYDILHQSELMHKWDDWSQINVEGSDARTAHKETFDSVLSVRADFEGLKKGFGRVIQLPDDLRSEIESHPGLLRLIEQKIPYQIKSQSFSDTSIWYVSINDVNGSYLCRGLALLVTGVALTHLFALSRGVPGRGGLGVGCASDYLGLFANPQRDEIYGPGLLRAYKLESDTARYPRVAVDDRLVEVVNANWKDLSAEVPGSPEYALAQYENLYGQVIRDFLFTDTDGVVALDFAGKKAASSFVPMMTSAGTDPAKVFSDALSFAQLEHKKFVSERNDLLADRYFRLSRYLHSRKRLWEKQ